jgi:hypothetical protein
MTERTIKRRMMLSRTRTGCQTCKLVISACFFASIALFLELNNKRTRRVKCDEAKPICQRCVKANRVCSGYSIAESKDKTSKTLKITYYVPSIFSDTKITGGKRFGMGSAQDQHALDYFFQWCLKCFPSDLMVHSQYYENLHEPAIKHAMAAMGLYFEIYRHDITGTAQMQRSMAAMQHYGKAISSLLKQPTKETERETSSTLVRACFLFVCIETSQGNHQSALSHLQSGFRLFQEGKEKVLQKANETRNTQEENIFHSLFGRLLCQLTNFDAADCARFFGLAGWSTSEHMAEFTNLDNARWALLTIIERLIQIRSLWASHNAYSNFLPDTANAYPSAEAILDHLAQEILRLDQWILALNIYLSHGVPVFQVCDAYVLGLCGFFLKFRITMDRASIGSHDCPHLDFSHITSLGETLLRGYEMLPPKSSCAPGEAAYGGSEETKCPVHGLFIDENRSQLRLDAKMSDGSSSDQQKLFLFLAVFCSLCVASVYSSDPETRHKAHDTVLSVCRCRAGWDMNLTNYIAHLLSPPMNSSNNESKISPSDHDASFQFDKLLSPETHVLLAQLRLLR